MTDALPRPEFLIDPLHDDRRNVLLDMGRNDRPARLQKPMTRIRERRDDVFFQSVVAERLRHDHIDGEIVVEFRRMTWNEMAPLGFICLENLRGNSRNLGSLE